VSDDPGESCGKCMGELVPDAGVLDARFVAGVGVLVALGWPDDDNAVQENAADTVLLVGRRGISRWAVPIAALGLRLSGAVPFGAVSVHDVDEPPDVDLATLLDDEGRRVVRIALLGDLPFEAARGVVAALDAPNDGDAEVDALVEIYDAAFALGAPRNVFPALSDALATGVHAGATDRIAALAVPLLGE
jgi:hypothetical protein